MANRAVLACVEDICRKIMGNHLPFGGKIIILLGDFRQTCPIIRQGSRTQIVAASIRSSPLWNEFTIERLTQPIRNAEDIEFANVIDDIGDGHHSNVYLNGIRHVSDTNEVIDFVFPPSIIENPIECLQRAILAPLNVQVDDYNDLILRRLTGNEKTYYAVDSLQERDDVLQNTNNGYLPFPDAILDYVAQRRPNGMPHKGLSIKIGGVYRLLRNFSIDRGLVKNIRVVITGIGQRLISVHVIKHAQTAVIIDEEELLIPRIHFKDNLYSGHTLLRRQFPLAPAYATTFHSCLGLTLDKIGVDLTMPVFTHGQLYTALSRIRNRTHACVRLRPNENSTRNITYKELLI